MARRPGAPGPWQMARVLDVSLLTPTIRSFVLQPARPFPFLAGQHVDLKLTAPDGYTAQRSYSIASAPERMDAIELAIERLPDGEVSGYFHDVVEAGDEIELRGPIGGHFVWSADRLAPLLLIGGGSGIVPLVSMLRHRTAAAQRMPAILLVSARTLADVAFRAELEAMAAADPDFTVRIATTREPARRPADYGRRIDRAMMQDIVAATPANADIFVCGSNGFVEAAAQGLIEAGIAAGTIRTERYGG